MNSLANGSRPTALIRGNGSGLKRRLVEKRPHKAGSGAVNRQRRLPPMVKRGEPGLDDQERLVAAHRDLARSHAQYADLFDFAPVGYATLDRLGCIREINLTGARMLGYDRRTLRERSLLPLIQRGDRSRFQLFLAKIGETQTQLIDEFKFRSRQKGDLRLQLVGKFDAAAHSRRGKVRVAFTDVTGLRRAERALMESEARFRSMAEAAPVMIWMSGPDAQRIYFNEAWLEFAGRTAEQEAGAGWTERIHPEDLRRVVDMYGACMRERQEFKIEYRLRRHDGDYRWVLGHAVPRFTSVNEFLGYTGCCMDITVHKDAEATLRRAQEELERRVRERTAALVQTNAVLQGEMEAHKQARLSFARLAEIVESTSDAILSRDLCGNIVSWNDGAEQLFGFSSADIVGQPVTVLVPADRAIELATIEARVRSRERVESLETVRLRKDGQRLDVSLTISHVRDANGGVVGFSDIMRDISEHKRTEEALVASETKFRGYVESAPDGVVIVNEQGQITLVNAQIERLFGYGRDELYGKAFADLMVPQLRERFKDGENFLACLFSHAVGEGQEFAGQRKNGAQFPVEISFNPLRTGERVLVCTSIRDITDRKRAEEALRRSEERYRKLFKEARSVQEILRNLSNKIIRVQEDERKKISRDLHDHVGQFLTAISVKLATMKVNHTGLPGVSGGTIEETQRLLQETMDVVHNFARELRPTILDELGLLPALRSHLKAFQELNGLQVSFRGTSAAEELDIEQKTVLYRIAQESLTNVAKHAEASRVDVVLRKTGKAIRMEIADDGKSFREDAKNLTRRKQRLGLLGMEERVRQVYGRFSIEPRAGRGTTVRVVLPYKPDARARQASAMVESGPTPANAAGEMGTSLG